MTKPISIDEIEFIEVDGLKIRFQRNKVGEGIPVVLTSPWPESLYAYQRIWPILGAEASLIAFDIPGFGQSEGRPQLMSPSAMGDFIPNILAALGLDRVHAIGPDVGTSALLFAANTHSNLFESLVVGSGATDTALTAGVLKDIIDAPSTASFEGGSGELFATGAIDRMMKIKPSPPGAEGLSGIVGWPAFHRGDCLRARLSYRSSQPARRAPRYSHPGSEYLGRT
jgi:pimeloyl-ACP methyl ester carboxylesterase